MTAGRGRDLLSRTEWTPEQLDHDRLAATNEFRRVRLEEPLEEYHEWFDTIRRIVADVLEQSDDLLRLDDQAMTILSDPAQREVFRYLAGPPISLDDLKVLVDATSITPRALEQQPELVQRLVDTIGAGLDRRRFPWAPRPVANIVRASCRRRCLGRTDCIPTRCDQPAYCWQARTRGSCSPSAAGSGVHGDRRSRQTHPYPRFGSLARLILPRGHAGREKG